MIQERILLIRSASRIETIFVSRKNWIIAINLMNPTSAHVLDSIFIDIIIADNALIKHNWL